MLDRFHEQLSLFAEGRLLEAGRVFPWQRKAPPSAAKLKQGSMTGN
jgi:hypothetical protein